MCSVNIGFCVVFVVCFRKWVKLVTKMTTEIPQNITKIFRFSFPTCTNEDILFKLEVPVEIPHNGCTRELVQRVLNMFHIPVYLEEELNERLAKFVADETQNYHNEGDEKLLNQVKNTELNVDGIVRNWEKLFKDNVVEYAEQKGTSDKEVFAAAYHKLVHSPALETILQVESSYASTVSDTLKNRDEDIKKITQRQTEEMEEKMRLLNTMCTEEDINALSAAHFEEQALAGVGWRSQLDALWQTQRAQYRAWLMTTLEEYQSTEALNTPSNSPFGTFTTDRRFPPAPRPAPPARLEDSFTIHLGSQLKQTHNLRIVAMDLLDLCRSDQDDNSEPSSRLQTALGLYSSELSAVVLLCEDEPGCCDPHMERIGRASTEFHFLSLDAQLNQITERVKEPVPPISRLQTSGCTRASCRRRCCSGEDEPGCCDPHMERIGRASSEFHYLSLDAQLNQITELVKEPAEKRNAQRLEEQSRGAAGPGTAGAAGGAGRVRGRRRLQTGDVFVTKHSNLAEVHVVFHLCVDQTLRSGDINSRHPVILGLRNILKTACCNDVTSLTLPLLLTHTLTDEMTAAWCIRRAELVLKCVKGFMLETASWGGAELRSVQLALPADLAPALFHSLAALLPSVFRTPNPLKFKATS